MEMNVLGDGMGIGTLKSHLCQNKHQLHLDESPARTLTFAHAKWHHQIDTRLSASRRNVGFLIQPAFGYKFIGVFEIGRIMARGHGLAQHHCLQT